MDANLEADFVEDILQDVKEACKTLQQFGFETIVLLASQDKHIEVGSPRGMQFNDENFDFVERFVKFCRDERHDTVKYEGVKYKSVKYETSSKNVTPKTPLSAPQTRLSSKKPETLLQQSVMDDEEEVSKCEVVIETDGDGDDYLEFDYADIDTVKEETGDATQAEPDSSGIKKRSQKTVNEMKSAKQQDDHGRTYYACDQCDKRYVAKKDLIIHKRKHTGDAPYSCELCYKSFRGSGLLRQHKQIHNAEKKFSCNLCGLAFQRRNSVYRHKTTVHCETPPQYACDICGRIFRDVSTRRMHRLRHTGYKPHLCTVCGMSFLELRGLTAHSRTHTGEKPFTCEKCGKTFRMKKNLLVHQRRKH